MGSSCSSAAAESRRPFGRKKDCGATSTAIQTYKVVTHTKMEALSEEEQSKIQKHIRENQCSGSESARAFMYYRAQNEKKPGKSGSPKNCNKPVAGAACMSCRSPKHRHGVHKSPPSSKCLQAGEESPGEWQLSQFSRPSYHGSGGCGGGDDHPSRRHCQFGRAAVSCSPSQSIDDDNRSVTGSCASQPGLYTSGTTLQTYCLRSITGSDAPHAMTPAMLSRTGSACFTPQLNGSFLTGPSSFHLSAMKNSLRKNNEKEQEATMLEDTGGDDDDGVSPLHQTCVERAALPAESTTTTVTTCTSVTNIGEANSAAVSDGDDDCLHASHTDEQQLLEYSCSLPAFLNDTTTKTSSNIHDGTAKLEKQSGKPTTEVKKENNLEDRLFDRCTLLPSLITPTESSKTERCDDGEDDDKEEEDPNAHTNRFIAITAEEDHHPLPGVVSVVDEEDDQEEPLTTTSSFRKRPVLNRQCSSAMCSSSVAPHKKHNSRGSFIVGSSSSTTVGSSSCGPSRDFNHLGSYDHAYFESTLALPSHFSGK